MEPRSAAEQSAQAEVGWGVGEYAAILTSEVVAAFRHDALHHIDFLSIHLSQAASALKVDDVRGARESVAEIDGELQVLARAIDSLKVLSVNPRRPGQPLTDVWEHLVRILGAHTRQAGAELELCRDECVDPLVPEPIVFALMTAAAIGLNAAATTHHRHGALLVEAERSGEDQVTLRVRFPWPVQRNDDTTLSLELVTALLGGCNGHISVSGSDQLMDLTMMFPFQGAPNR